MAEINKMSVYFHDDFLKHRNPPGVFDSGPSDYLDLQIDQPEGPERIQNTRAIMAKSELSEHVVWKTPQPATDQELEMFHTAGYIARLKEVDEVGDYMSASTYLHKGGLHTVRLSAGAALGAVRSVISGETTLGYGISRPPSHHAQPDEADGYCFINNIGLAALEALNQGFERIAIIDWDVHHGNGTQEGFYQRNDVLTISLHMDHQSWGKTHLQSGDVDEVGRGKGQGYNLNLPLPFGSGNHCYIQAFDKCIVPAIENFKPDLILISNGQDANQFDPNGRQCLTMSGYYQLASRVRTLAEKFCDGKTVMTQEGGYNPTYAPYCAYAVAAGLLGVEMKIADPIAFYPDDIARAERDIEALISRHPLL